VSRSAKILVKIAAFAAVGWTALETYSFPYGGFLSIIPAALFFAAAFALIWIGDRLVRRFVKPS
jgi:hypothetical protein